MSWFQLDPQSLANRAEGSASTSFGASVGRGIIGFTLVSIAAFAPWGVFGETVKAQVGELGMYVACTLVFLVLSGLLLHKLIIGSGSLPRFYKLFTLAFTAYSIAWIAGYMLLRGHLGSVVGLLAGAIVMGWMFAAAFDARRHLVKIVAALFVLNSLGYYIGWWIELYLFSLPDGYFSAKRTQDMVARMQWALTYGFGLGAGLGVAFYLCQEQARALIHSNK
jgi:hypothetical protein